VATGAEREPRGFGAIGWLGRKCSGSKASGLSQYLEWRWGVGANEEGDGGPALGDNALHEVPDLSGGEGVSEFLCKLTSGGQTSFEQNV
jgi:hypothetical protein